MIKAAGILFISESHVLLLQRSAQGDQSGTWALPGGKVEQNESLAQAAVRECFEEMGACPVKKIWPFTRSVDSSVDYTTFIAQCDRFTPTLNDEHLAYFWFPVDDLPDNLHPGVASSLRKLELTELKVAEGIRDGYYPSPSRFQNVWLFAMRITGTGVAYRQAHDEYVVRDSNDYCNAEFLARCNGLPVIIEHPEKLSMDSNDFTNRIVGTTLLPYIANEDGIQDANGKQVWGITKIYNDEAVDMLRTKQASTSPTVVFLTPALNTSLTLEDGSTLFIEGKPSLVDHLAICERGVWDKGQAPSGVKISTVGD